jgi:DNA-binding HxlR family transcriptional regulator
MEAARHEGYRLTKRGRCLLPVLKAATAWGLANIKGTDAHEGVSDTRGQEMPTQGRGYGTLRAKD